MDAALRDGLGRVRLFAFQRGAVSGAFRRGRGALFSGCHARAYFCDAVRDVLQDTVARLAAARVARVAGGRARPVGGRAGARDAGHGRRGEVRSGRRVRVRDMSGGGGGGRNHGETGRERRLDDGVHADGQRTDRRADSVAVPAGGEARRHQFRRVVHGDIREDVFRAHPAVLLRHGHEAVAASDGGEDKVDEGLGVLHVGVQPVDCDGHDAAQYPHGRGVGDDAGRLVADARAGDGRPFRHRQGGGAALRRQCQRRAGHGAEEHDFGHLAHRDLSQPHGGNRPVRLCGVAKSGERLAAVVQGEVRAAKVVIPKRLSTVPHLGGGNMLQYRRP